MTTYKAIQDDYRRHHGKTIKPCWIAHVKELNGLAPKPSPNRESQGKRKHPCPPDVQPLIEASMRRLGLIC